MYRYGCFLKWWYPKSFHFNRVFHYKSSILVYPYFWKHPYTIKSSQTNGQDVAIAVSFDHEEVHFLKRIPLDALGSGGSPFFCDEKGPKRLVGIDRGWNTFQFIWMFPKIVGWNPPNHPFVHRDFHYFHHPFWGTPIFGNTHIGIKPK